MERENTENNFRPEASIEVFKEFLLIRVPNILSDRKVAVTRIKKISFILCTSWFIYQLCKFTALYFNYPTEKDTEVLYSNVTYTGDSIPFVEPALIICNSNPVKRERFCFHKPEECYTPENVTEFCLKYSYYCKRSKLPTNFSVGVSSQIPLEDLLPFAQKANEFISVVTSGNRDILTNVSEQMYVHFDMDVKRWLLCYTLDYHLVSNKYPYEFDAKEEAKHDLSLNYITIDFDAKNTANCDIVPGGLLGVGSPFEPFIPKLRIKSGMKYTIKVKLSSKSGYSHTMAFQKVHQRIAAVEAFIQAGVTDAPWRLQRSNEYAELWATQFIDNICVQQDDGKAKEEENRLPCPYHTNCRNYSEDWLMGYKSGPRSREMCIYSCLQERARESFCEPCISRYFYREGVFPIKWMCNDTCEPYRHSTEPEFDIYVDKEKCSALCKDACLKYSFFYSVDKVLESAWPDSFSCIEIKLQDPPVKIVSLKPRYKPIELFSYIGSYMGLWLGFCAITMNHFVISLVFIVWIAVKRSIRRCISRFKKMNVPISDDIGHLETRI